MLTRRNFIERLAAVGGASLAYEGMVGVGLLEAAQSTPFELRGDGKGVKIAIIGGGLAGMTVAYELGKLGYACSILEARPRPGGRAHTIRRGTVSEEEGSAQVCNYDAGQYFNCGAMRIAYHHSTTLAYCRELGVPVETFALLSEAAYIYQTKTAGLQDRRVRQREVHTDLDGYVSELLTKAVNGHALDDALTAEDRERLIAYLQQKGALVEGRYRGSQLRGPDPERNPDGSARYTPLALSELLGSRAGSYLDPGFQYQQTMMQVVDGTSRLPEALAARLKDKIRYEAAVQTIRHTANGVMLGYTDKSGRPQQLTADYCVCALPLTVLARMDTDFSEERKKIFASTSYSAAGKMGIQFKRRFWEEDDQIFGGSSKTDMDIAQVIYPSSGYLTKKGVVVGYYLQGQSGRPIGDKTPQERLELALEQGSKIHPQYRTEFDTAFSVAWHRVKWSYGAWSNLAAANRRILLEPEGRTYMAGDHMNMNAWMQGAFESARQVATQIHARAAREKTTLARP
ncbi:MAG TPA: flavin monoamine oxidase family protein [Vicinamibacterales bacterium]|nr:flavin monoamine oxidase family protein [Vicinamibacterales bacterium]